MESIQSYRKPIYKQVDTSISNVKKLEQFESVEDYFKYLMSNEDALREALEPDGSVLDQRNKYGDTLLHVIAAAQHLDLTHVIEPYLTNERVAARDSLGKTVLCTHIFWAVHHNSHRNYGTLLRTYFKYADEGALLSLLEDDLLQKKIGKVNERIKEIDAFSNEYYLGDDDTIMRIHIHKTDAVLVLKYLNRIENKIKDLKNVSTNAI